MRLPREYTDWEKNNTMNLSDIVKKMIKEDTWGNNPSSAGSMSPGISPESTTQPSATSRKVNVSKLFEKFRSDLAEQEQTLIDRLKTTLKNNFLKKTITIQGSKGSFGQLNNTYTLTVTDVDIFYLKDWYYIVFIGNEDGEKTNKYYLDKDKQIISVDDAAQSISPTGRTGGMVDASPTNRNILPQG